ncbi:MAG: penicillin-binding transpeptidase domain-containing protein [Acidobacteriota bacterium]
MIIPAILSVIFSFGLMALATLLLYSVLRAGPTTKVDTDEAYSGIATASRWLHRLRILFILFCLVVLGFHAYWALCVDGPILVDENYVKIRDSRDQRNRRIQEAGLRGWVFDRHDSPDSALIHYRNLGTKIVREYPLGETGAHLIGYKDLVRGEAGIEKAYDKVLTSPLSAYNALVSTVPVGKDLVTTIDSQLQRSVAEQLAGKRGAVVVLDIKTGGILALASNPNFSPKELSDEQYWQKISTDEINKPLVNRATGQYYLPGSSFKTVVAAAALIYGLDKEHFACQAGGFTPPGSEKAIEDDQNSVHGHIDFERAFAVSCNQYFAQLGLKLGAARLAETAKLFGIHIDESPEEARKTLIDNKLWNAEGSDLAAAFGPNQSRMMLNTKIYRFDLAIQSIGQGYTQMTPLQMALIAAGVANNGQVMRPKLELNRAPKPLSTALPPQVPARLQQLMIGVVRSGTARAAFTGSPITVGGKTGTAQREVIVYDTKTGKPRLITDTKTGKQYTATRLSIDAWFIGFAPAENPQIAFAVIIEDGGHGGAVAAPIARNTVEKAAQLGLINAHANNTKQPLAN